MRRVERAGEDAAHDVNDREHPGQERGGVADRDRDDVRGEPEVRVEHRLQHLHRVAASGEMMRDDEGDEPDRAGAGCADAVAKDSLENERDDDRAPADEDGGRIEIRHRRAFLEIHPGDQTEGVDREREEQEIKGGAIERPRPTQPRTAGEQKGQNVKHHAVGERIDVVEKKLERRAPGRIRLFVCEPSSERLDDC